MKVNKLWWAIVIFLTLAVVLSGIGFVKADVPPDLPMYNMSRTGSLLKLDRSTWGQMIGHTIRTGEMKDFGGLPYWIKTYYVGRAVPKRGILPHELYVDFMVFPPTFAMDAGIYINARYRIEMGGGYVGHTVLSMIDRDFDMRPDKVTRRWAQSKNLMFYLSGPSKWKTPIYDSKLPNDIPEWNQWLMWFLEQYEKEGAFVEGGVM